MKAFWYLSACTAAVVAGAGVSHFLPIPASGVPVRLPVVTNQAARPATESPVSADPQAPTAPSGVPASLGSLFDQLSNDPFLNLTDEQISTLASGIDLKREASIALLNGVLDPRLHARLWDECLRANAAFMPLKDLCDAAAKATGIRPETGFPLLFERLRNDSQLGVILGTPSRSPLLNSYCIYWETHASSAAELIGLLPPGIPFLQYEIVSDFESRKASQATSLEILGLAKSHRLEPELIRSIAEQAIRRAKSPEQMTAALNALEEDAIPHRNWILATCPAESPYEDRAEQLFQALDHATSQTGVDYILNSYLQINGQEKAAQLLAWLDSQPPTERYTKTRQRLEKKAEGQ